MKSTFDLDSESCWQAYRIANVFLVWKVDKPEDKKQAQQIVSEVIKKWYRLGRRHERVNVKIKKLRQLECGGCGCKLNESNWGGYVREWPEDLRKEQIALDIGNCKKCYYAKYENFEPVKTMSDNDCMDCGEPTGLLDQPCPACRATLERDVWMSRAMRYEEERDKLKEDYAKLDCEFDIDHAEMKERAGQAYAKGFEDAREMAAGLVEKDHKFCSLPMCEIANKIRALRPSEGKDAK